MIEFKKTYRSDELTQSDLQGNAMSFGIKYVGPKKIRRVSEIEDIFLQYGMGEMDINTAKRYILDIILKAREEENGK